MPTPNTSDLNNLFLTRIDQYHKRIFQHHWQTDPYVSLIKREFFDVNEGRLPTVINLRSELPTGYPDDLTNLQVSDPLGTGPNGSGCDVDAKLIGFGQDTRQFQIQVDAWMTPVLCLTDLEFDHQAEQAISNMEEGLRNYSTRKMADWARYQNIGMIDNKAVIVGTDNIVEVENQDYNHDEIILDRQNTATGGSATTIDLDAGASAVVGAYVGQEIHIISGTGIGSYATITAYNETTKEVTVADWLGGADPVSGDVFRILTTNIPQQTLDWNNIGYFYEELARRGADSFAVGFAAGEAVYSLSIGPEVKRELYGDESAIREDIRYAMPMENFRARGITQAVNGMACNLDLFPIRLDAAGQKLYPHINVAADGTGTKSASNPDYRPVSKGGKAVYEYATILTTEVYKANPRPIDKTRYQMAGFDAINYTAEINWINNKTMAGDNDLGNKGYYRADWQLAAKPERPEMGYSILFKIASEV